jgi:hypothetical protein
LIIGAILGIIVLLGAGAFFFQVEYEEFEDDVQMAENEAQAAEDPYAWAKAKQNPVNIPQTEPAAPVAAAVAAPPAASNHPGWLWDEATNSWVPDPNYTPDQ